MSFILFYVGLIKKVHTRLILILKIKCAGTMAYRRSEIYLPITSAEELRQLQFITSWKFV